MKIEINKIVEDNDKIHIANYFMMTTRYSYPEMHIESQDAISPKTEVIKELEPIRITFDEEILEDLYDGLISQSRKDEPTIPWEELKAEIE